jgi:hypothetical protein
MSETSGNEREMPLIAKILVFIVVYFQVFVLIDWLAGGRIPSWLAWPAMLVPWLMDLALQALGGFGEAILHFLGLVLDPCRGLLEALGGYMVVSWLLLGVLGFVVGTLLDSRYAVVRFIGVVSTLVLCWLVPNLAAVVYSGRAAGASESGEGEKADRMKEKVDFFGLDRTFRFVEPEAVPARPSQVSSNRPPEPDPGIQEALAAANR